MGFKREILNLLTTLVPPWLFRARTAMSMHLSIFKIHLGQNKAKNQRLNLAFILITEIRHHA
jgi:hypothetical protein